MAGDGVESFFEINEATVEGALAGAGLVDEGVEGEDVVCGAMIGAETGLEWRADCVLFGPSGQAGLKNHGIEFCKDGANGEAAIVVGVKGVAFAFEDGVYDLAVEGRWEGAREERGKGGGEGRSKLFRGVENEFGFQPVNASCFVPPQPLQCAEHLSGCDGGVERACCVFPTLLLSSRERRQGWWWRVAGWGGGEEGAAILVQDGSVDEGRGGFVGAEGAPEGGGVVACLVEEAGLAVALEGDFLGAAEVFVMGEEVVGEVGGGVSGGSAEAATGCLAV